MPDPDRFTGIFGDQIKDHTVTPQEFDTTNSPSDQNVLIWDASSDKMKWESAALSGYGVGENVYSYDETESTTSLTAYQDKVVYSNTFDAGTYRVAMYAEAKAQTSQTEYQVVLTVDGVEWVTELGDSSSASEWDTIYGFFQVTFLTTTTHIFKIQYRTTKSNKTASIRRARMEVWRMLEPVS